MLSVLVQKPFAFHCNLKCASWRTWQDSTGGGRRKRRDCSLISLFRFCCLFDFCFILGIKKNLDLVSSDFSLLNVRNSGLDPTNRTFWGRRRRNHTCNDYAFFPSWSFRFWTRERKKWGGGGVRSGCSDHASSVVAVANLVPLHTVRWEKHGRWYDNHLHLKTNWAAVTVICERSIFSTIVWNEVKN